jgi:hypothetical protein
MLVKILKKREEEEETERKFHSLTRRREKEFLRGNLTHESEKIISNVVAFGCASIRAIDIDFLSSLHFYPRTKSDKRLPSKICQLHVQMLIISFNLTIYFAFVDSMID